MEPSRTVYVDPHLNAPSSRSNGNSNDRVEPRRDERRGTAGSHSGRRDGDHHEAGAVSRDEHSRWPREAERGRRAVATVGTSPTEGLTLDPTTSPATVVLSPARASLLTTTTAPGGTHAERTQEAPFRERQPRVDPPRTNVMARWEGAVHGLPSASTISPTPLGPSRREGHP